MTERIEFSGEDFPTKLYSIMFYHLNNKDEFYDTYTNQWYTKVNDGGVSQTTGEFKYFEETCIVYKLSIEFFETKGTV